MTEIIPTQFKVEGQPAFPIENTENVNSPDSSSVQETKTDQTPSSQENQNATEKKNDGSPENFADHPRWKEREEDWTRRFNDQEKRHVDDLAKLRQEFIQTKTPEQKAQTVSAPEEVPAWFGGDEQQWIEFQKWNKGLAAQAEENALKRLASQNEAEQKKIDDATTYLNDQVSELEKDKDLNPQGEKVDRNKILKFVLDNELVDTKGRWNYKAAFKMMKAGDVFKAKEALIEKRQVAAATTSENRSETKPPPFMTNQDFSRPENRPW